MNRYIQATLFPELDRKLFKTMPGKKKEKRLPVEIALDLFPRREIQMVFEDYFPGFRVK